MYSIVQSAPSPINNKDVSQYFRRDTYLITEYRLKRNLYYGSLEKIFFSFSFYKITFYHFFYLVFSFRSIQPHWTSFR